MRVSISMSIKKPLLVQGATPVLGVVNVPVSGKTYYAVAGRGAYVREPDGSTRQIRAAEFSINDTGLVLVGSASHASTGEGGVCVLQGAAHPGRWRLSHNAVLRSLLCHRQQHMPLLYTPHTPPNHSSLHAFAIALPCPSL